MFKYDIVIQKNQDKIFEKHFKLPHANSMWCGVDCSNTMEIEASIENNQEIIYDDIKEEFDTETVYGSGDIIICLVCYKSLKQ